MFVNEKMKIANIDQSCISYKRLEKEEDRSLDIPE
jgi:hypothetical protein